jgi:hypothetical protein
VGNRNQIHTADRSVAASNRAAVFFDPRCALLSKRPEIQRVDNGSRETDSVRQGPQSVEQSSRVHRPEPSVLAISMLFHIELQHGRERMAVDAQLGHNGPMRT